MFSRFFRVNIGGFVVIMFCSAATANWRHANSLGGAER
jgi:hypothetical protein